MTVEMTPEAVAKLRADCKLAADVMAETGTFEIGQGILKDADKMLEALAARLAEVEQRAERVNRLQKATAADWDAVCQQKREITEAAAAPIAQLEAALSGGALTKTDSQELLSRLGSAETETARLTAELAEARKLLLEMQKRAMSTRGEQAYRELPTYVARRCGEIIRALAKGDQA